MSEKKKVKPITIKEAKAMFQAQANAEEKNCKHKNTVAINEEGHTGVYCSDCGEQLEKEC